MHLHYLGELADRFELAAVCDIVGDNARACAQRYGAPAAFSDCRELIRQPLDAVLVLTSGSHAPIAIAAAQAGLHVLVEKPMCFSVTEGLTMVAAAEQAGVTLMVAYPKRYDAAFARFRQEAAAVENPRLLRVTTLESQLQPYIAHYRLPAPAPVPAEVAERLRDGIYPSIRSANRDLNDLERPTHHLVLLDTLVHELNTVRGLFGEPDRLAYVDVREHSLTAMLRVGELPGPLHWLHRPGLAPYKMKVSP